MMAESISPTGRATSCRLTTLETIAEHVDAHYNTQVKLYSLASGEGA